jgi:hypothetical protein
MGVVARDFVKELQQRGPGRRPPSPSRRRELAIDICD